MILYEYNITLDIKQNTWVIHKVANRYVYLKQEEYHIYTLNDTFKGSHFLVSTFKERYNGIKLGSIKFCRIVKYVVSHLMKPWLKNIFICRVG